MCVMYEKDVISIKDKQKKLSGKGKWIDIKRFLKSNRLYNPDGILDLFGSFSNQLPVCDCLLSWIFDNFYKVKGWRRLALQNKAVNFADRRIENMRNPLTHSDDTALYLLTRMYDNISYILPWREVQAFDCPEGS